VLVALTAQHVGNSGHSDGPILSLVSPATVDRIFSNTAWHFAEALVTMTSYLTWSSIGTWGKMTDILKIVI